MTIQSYKGFEVGQEVVILRSDAHGQRAEIESFLPSTAEDSDNTGVTVRIVDGEFAGTQITCELLEVTTPDRWAQMAMRKRLRNAMR